MPIENDTAEKAADGAQPCGMLEVRHLKKEYKSKNGVTTKALNDVSLVFPETGMVFILGKSGSGKSTLLNVCGGLDRMDGGEIIIKGKSSKDFSAQDFDSYRNTFVGFVFQEYNILNEFTVEQNIALALELQNKKKDPALVARILEDVEMTAFAQRKPNTLSGGQKQRVAIARALVKEPEIIMADEPTGALDSKTGQQVFDTLKKLSQTKLVIVISHDRDFAEQYGDRIIELKDGQIISDQTRAVEGEGAKNIRFYGTDTVCVANGANITDKELESIKAFLMQSGGSAVISTSREKITQFKEDRPEISVGSFENIKEQPKVKEYESPELIRSHLPVKHAIKMGASGLKTKPVRLVFTVLLSVIAFVLFGLASTLMLFNDREVRIQTFKDSNVSHIILGKDYQVTYDYGDGDAYTNFNQTRFTDAEYESILTKYSGAIPVISRTTQIRNFSVSSNANEFYGSYVNGVVPANDKLKIIEGRLPAADDEIAVTDFMFDMFKSKGSKLVYGENNTQVTVNNYRDILFSPSKPVKLSLVNIDYKIVGIFKGMTVPNDYKDLKEKADTGERPDDTGFSSYMWQEERSKGLYSCVAVTPSLFNSIKEETASSDEIELSDYFRYSAEDMHITDKENYHDFFSYMATYEEKTLPVYALNGETVTAIGNGEAAFSHSIVAKLYYEKLASFLSSLENDSDYQTMLQDERQKLYDGYSVPEPDWEDYKNPDGSYDNDKYNSDWDEWNANREEYVENALMEFRKDAPYLRLKKQLDTDPQLILWKLYISAYSLQEVKTNFAIIEKMFNDLDLKVTCYLYNDTTEYTEVKIKGYVFTGSITNIGGGGYSVRNAAYLGKDLYDNFYRSYSNMGTATSSTKYEEPKDAYIDYIVVPYDGSASVIEKLVDADARVEADDSAVHIKNSVSEQLNTVTEIASSLELGFVIAGTVLALFAFLLMFNFISASITAKKKDIGILRAIGARTTDVFKIFISEALIIALICFVISAAASFGLCVLLNSIIMNDVGISASLFVFGPLSVLCVLAIALVTALISTVIPVAIYSRKPPIASIRAL